MKISLMLLIAFMVLFGVSVAKAQDKRVAILGIEVNEKPVKSKFEVQIILGDKVLKAKTDNNSFLLPAVAVGKDVGLLIKFDKYLLTFFFVRAANFDEEWVIGVDTKPFMPEYLKDADPAKTAVIYYVRFPNNSDEHMRLVTVVGKPTVTIKRM